MRVGERFSPHPNLKKVYGIYLLLAAITPLVVTAWPVLAVYTFLPEVWREVWMYLLIPLAAVLVILGFTAYWIPKYYDSISYVLTEDEVVVERGVWWRMKHTVPYARVMSVDVIQGPISRMFSVGSVHVHTAGYTGTGGTAGPGTRAAEATIWGLPNFTEIRDTIIEMVKGRPLFGASRAVVSDVGAEILEELRKIRKTLKSDA